MNFAQGSHASRRSVRARRFVGNLNQRSILNSAPIGHPSTGHLMREWCAAGVLYAEARETHQQGL